MQAFKADHIFDGAAMRAGVLLIDAGHVVEIASTAPAGVVVTNLGAGVICPGFVDLQVNGGDGLMLNDAPTVATLERMATAHARGGTLALLPTLITDRDAVLRATVDAVAVARVPGIAGLHLEGPHLSVARKGAHEAALIRAMTPDDLAFICAAKRRVGRLVVTVAPESVTMAQIAQLADAGVVVSLGHTDCGVDVARAAVSAGARMATHLFNAMSPLGNREPGLVGAVLTDGRLDAGLIADGIHVHPATMRAALAAKTGPGEVFLVTDAMAPAGTDMTAFTLNGRKILRQDGRLTLEDGTLAGADLDFPRAIRVLIDQVGVPLPQALAMATRIPARAAGIDAGQLRVGDAADFVHLDEALQLRGVWRGGTAMSRLAI
jgi:N-acetylglucosamine-6-phosphate deacetylase